MPEPNEPLHPTPETKGKAAEPLVWPVIHPLLEPPGKLLPWWRFSGKGNRGVFVPDALADELNRWATVRACAKMMRTSRDITQLSLSIATNSDALIVDMHARLKKETTDD